MEATILNTGGLQMGINGLKVVCHFEGERNPKCGWIESTLSYKPYLDPVGIPTIGIGSISYPDGTRVKMTDHWISEAYAYEIMNWELDEKENAVKAMMRKSGLFFGQNQFDALVSMAYNCGIGILENGSSLRTALGTGDLKKIEAAMNLYVKATVKKWGISRKVTLPGLVNRRKCEFILFSQGRVEYFN